MSDCTRIAVPNGSLRRHVFPQLERAGFPLSEPDRAQSFCCGRHGCLEFFERDRRMIPRLVAGGNFAAGITGLDLLVDTVVLRLEDWIRLADSQKTLAHDMDWLRGVSPQRDLVPPYNASEGFERCAEVKLTSEATYYLFQGTRRFDVELLLDASIQQLVRLRLLTGRPDPVIRWVLAVKAGDMFPGRGVGCELLGFGRAFQSKVIGAAASEVVRIEGKEECMIADGYCDSVLVVSETGKSLSENGLKPLEGCETILRSFPCLVAKSSLPSAQEGVVQELAERWGTLNPEAIVKESGDKISYHR